MLATRSTRECNHHGVVFGGAYASLPLASEPAVNVASTIIGSADLEPPEGHLRPSMLARALRSPMVRKTSRGCQPISNAYFVDAAWGGKLRPCRGRFVRAGLGEGEEPRDTCGDQISRGELGRSTTAAVNRKPTLSHASSANPLTRLGTHGLR
jgi:hypothetical protein